VLTSARTTDTSQVTGRADTLAGEDGFDVLLGGPGIDGFIDDSADTTVVEDSGTVLFTNGHGPLWHLPIAPVPPAPVVTPVAPVVSVAGPAPIDTHATDPAPVTTTLVSSASPPMAGVTPPRPATAPKKPKKPKKKHKKKKKKKKTSTHA
jgi:hypothetical protein